MNEEKEDEEEEEKEEEDEEEDDDDEEEEEVEERQQQQSAEDDLGFELQLFDVRLAVSRQEPMSVVRGGPQLWSTKCCGFGSTDIEGAGRGCEDPAGEGRVGRRPLRLPR